MGIAAQVMAWQQQKGSWRSPLPAPFQPAASPAGGMPFLTGVLGDPNAAIVVEAAFGADLKGNPALWTWYDITTDVRQAGGQGVSISPMGRADEASQAQPAGCVLQVDNTTGDYTANHPGSKWWPFVRRNTPIRVRLYVYGQMDLQYQGYINGWLPSWDITGNLAVVTVSASGILRRLNQGKTPLRSPLYRAVSRLGPYAWWPLEEGDSAAQAASGLSAGRAMTPSGTVGFGKTSTLAGAASVVEVASGATLTGPITPTAFDFLPGVGTIAVDLWVKLYAEGTNATTLQLADLISTPAGGLPEFQVQASNSGTPRFLFLAKDPTGGTIITLNSGTGTPGSSVNPFDGGWHNVYVTMAQSGGNVLFSLYVDGALADTATAFLYSLLSLHSATLMNQLSAGVSGTATFSSLAIFYVLPASILYQAGVGYVGETATARLARLCLEQGVPIDIVGASDTLMGPQGMDTFLNLIRECETTDDGLLYDGLGPGLGYITRQSRYDRPAALILDMAADPPQVGDPFEPKDDDQRNRNLVKVDRRNGSSATYEDSTGPLGTDAIQDYDASVTVNTPDDSGLLFRAAWEVRKGTVDGYRYPTLAFDLAATPALARAWLAARLADRADVLNVASKATQHPPGTISQLMQGYTTFLSPFDWTVVANCSPFEPWRVAAIEASITEYCWRLDSAASTLAQAYPAGSTSIQVAVADGYLWSTAAADYPRDLDIGGVKVTATAVSGASSPQTFTVTATAYPLSGGAAVRLWRPPTLAL